MRRPRALPRMPSLPSGTARRAAPGLPVSYAFCKTAAPMSASPIWYPQAAAQLQRRAEARQEPGWVDAALADPATRYLVSRATTHLIRREPRTQIAFLRPAPEALVQ